MSIADKACRVGGEIGDHPDIQKKIRGKGGLRAGAGRPQGSPSRETLPEQVPQQQEAAYEIKVPSRYDVRLIARTRANDNKKRGELQ